MVTLEDKINAMFAISKKQADGELEKFPVWLSALEMGYIAGLLMKQGKPSKFDESNQKGIYKSFDVVMKTWKKR